MSPYIVIRAYSLKKLLSLFEVNIRKSKMIKTNISYNPMILLNFRCTYVCIGSLVAIHFADLGVDFYFHSEPPFSHGQCTAHPHKLCNTKILVGTVLFTKNWTTNGGQSVYVR